ncbi:hypothetical protein SKAU_G00230410 [Synaphobranchus kaupii]|uniref:Aldehyde oxidase/xanthine dehydrogenase second molybdopterin binding domain-containing protein n=1 Tax=Synaphobranchus kaupii TaxID=118154 RepID=A0A9Q1ISA9_SYNKA|nr:hypothetical protein SKAU_G00230410 [Synaphobranchus kaupii]
MAVKDACEKLMKLLDPIMRKYPKYTWPQWNIRSDIVMDVGRSRNPALDIGQIEGTFVQGIGLYTIEELQFSPEGVLMTRGPSQYKIPVMCDVPPQLNVHRLADTQTPDTIYSAKARPDRSTRGDTQQLGVGEPPLSFGITILFAIKEAIAAAHRDSGLSGTFILNSPATAERIHTACVDQFAQMV